MMLLLRLPLQLLALVMAMAMSTTAVTPAHRARVLARLDKGQSVSTFPVEAIPKWQSDCAMSLAIQAPLGGPAMNFMVVPLTQNVGLNVSESQRGEVFFRGFMQLASDATYTNIKNPESTIVYLSCDARNDSTVTPKMKINALMESKPKAILLYSQQGNCCGISGLANGSHYQTVFTMMDVGEAASALNTTNQAGGFLQATIMGNLTRAQADDGSQTNNSAVAMSVLYSITGLITLLFLVIIATGAIRAHRYPERYGPQSGQGGRPRQSRAKGIARAVLDTLPIIKFGTPPQSAQGKPDPAMELEEGGLGRSQRDMSLDHVQVHHLSTIPEDAEAVSSGTNGPQRESRVGPAPSLDSVSTLVENPTGPAKDENLGCSICTEDFLVGEDVRVLPCDHKFHPSCVDPWLVNVSGTCPLCRLDLRPSKIGGNDEDDELELPPPLGEDDTDRQGGSPGTNPEVRRSSRFFDLNTLRTAPVEERIQVLRRYRAESREGLPVDGAIHEDERNQRSRLTSRLKERFRVRTRAQSPGRQRQRPTSQGPGQIV